MPDPVDAHQLMATLRAQLDTLNKMLSLCATDCRVFEIDAYADGEVPDVITPVGDNGENALGKAQRAIRGLSRLEDQHPGSVMRSPGVIVVDKDLSEIVESINALKDDLKQHINTLCPSPRQRHRYVQSQFPGRVMLQVYRHLYTNERPVQKIRFTWSPYTATSKTLSRSKALELLTKRSTTGIDHTIENRFKALQMATEYVRSSSNKTLFTIKKPRPPFPKANVYYGTNDVTDVPASLPLIIFSKDKTIDISDMPSYNKNIRRKPRSDKQPLDLIYKPLYLYQKL